MIFILKYETNHIAYGLAKLAPLAYLSVNGILPLRNTLLIYTVPYTMN